MKRVWFLLIMLWAVVMTGCQQKEGKSPERGTQNTELRNTGTQEPGTQEPGLSAQDSGASLASKGVITSVHDIPVFSMVSEVITERLVKEGMRVRKGQVLFRLDDNLQRSDIEKTRHEIEQAKFQYDNILVGQGYDPAKPQTIPLKIRNIARVRSSLNLSEQTLQKQKLVLQYYTIHAPISGVLTDVEAKQYDMADKGKELCHIIDTDHLRVEFHILETELGKYQKGTVVHFSTLAYPNDVYSATVAEISPKVDENGMIKLKANVISNHSLHQLMVGMTAIVRK